MNSTMTKWQIDASHSSANFSVRHMMIAKVHGGFEKISGQLELDAANPSHSNLEVSIDASSINTRDAQRDAHLKSADFFDVEKFPNITFKSKRIERTGGESLRLTGDLTIHGITKEVSLNVEGPSAEMKDPFGNVRIGASAETRINRKDFGLHWNAALEAGGFLVGDDVNIHVDVQFIKQTP
jgi:polyisoprenoid-binding protein YceI